MTNRWRLASWVTALVTLTALLLAALSPGSVQVNSAHAARSAGPPSRLAQVRYIYHGLSVQAPRGHRTKAKISMSLYNQYFLQTLSQQRASIRFKDGTTLHMNQTTDAVLRSPHVTFVSKGEVFEALAPGTNHRVQTGSAVAAAVGTVFDVKVVRGGVYFIVVHGAVRVRGKKGPAVTVKTNHESLVINNQAAQPPQPVDASKLTNWSRSIPTPDLGENIALDANGGKVVSRSSQYLSASQGDAWNVKYIIDGRLDTGWESATGQITNQWVKIGLAKTSQINRVVIDPGATQNDPSTADLKDFQIRVSTTGTADANFTTVYSGTCTQNASLQTFTFPHPISARYVEIFALNNWGSLDWIAITEFEVVTSPKG